MRLSYQKVRISFRDPDLYVINRLRGDRAVS
jgi:hypothetical protein